MIDHTAIKRDYSLTDIFESLTGQKLKRAGQSFKSNCVFHDEKNASFNIFLKDNRYYCYGCQKSGNNIDFVMNYMNTDFKTACEIITGNIQAREPKRLKDADPCEYEQTELTEITKEIYQHFFNILVLTQQGRNYLHSRGLNDFVINEYQIKSIDNSREISEKMLSKFKLSDLKASGLFTDYKKYPFLFSQPCIIFTVFKDRKPIYFSNRFLNYDPRFYKLSKVKQSYFIGNLNRDHIFIFESFFDAISFHILTGSDNFIISSGLLSDTQYLKMLRDIPDKKFIIAFDNDKTGIEKINELIKIDPERSLKFSYEDFKKSLNIKSDQFKDVNDLLKIYAVKQNSFEVIQGIIRELSEKARKDFDFIIDMLITQHKQTRSEAERNAILDLLNEL
jgi:DNA primase